jgi:hypothetical protein
LKVQIYISFALIKNEICPKPENHIAPSAPKWHWTLELKTFCFGMKME